MPQEFRQAGVEHEFIFLGGVVRNLDGFPYRGQLTVAGLR